MRLAIEKEGPGIAFWRAKKHGWDRWLWGLIEVMVTDWWNWSLALEVLNFNMAPGMHLDMIDLLRVKIGPFEISVGYIVDLQN